MENKDNDLSTPLLLNNNYQIGKNFIEENTSNQENKKCEKVSIWNIAKLSTYLGFISFGGPVAHIGYFRKTLIEDEKIISEKHFTDLLSLCSFLPGPTSTQLLTAISTTTTGSILGGLVNFLCFNCPGMIILIFIASFLNSWVEENYSDQIKLVYSGIMHGAISLILQAAITLSVNKVNKNISNLMIVVFSSLIYFLFRDYKLTMLILMILSGIYNIFYANMYLRGEDKSPTIITENVEDFYNIPYTGPLCIFLFCFTYVLLFCLRMYYPDNLYCLIMEVFYRIGCLIFGGGHVVIPLILEEMIKLHLLSGKDVLIAFSYVSLMPGPMFNMAAYIGTLIGGISLGIITAFSLFAPGILILFGFLPYVKQIKSNFHLNEFLNGVALSAFGFIFTSAYILFLDISTKSYIGNISSVLNIILSYYLLEKMKVHTFLVLIISTIVYIMFLQII